ncbi:MAG: tetratricopeptide repeat protein [Luteitalea sp.]|nr:tetratricopeptide repeat protein [Luteitalea sp.]
MTQERYTARLIRQMYPLLRDDHLRYLAKWGLIQPARAGGEITYGFADLVVIRQAAAELERGARFRGVVRTLVAEREGQLALDFRPARQETSQARIVTLLPRPRRTVPVDLHLVITPEDQALAERYFLEGTSLDEGGPETQEEAMATYRKALALDPELVPAIVNLGNIRYARNEIPEAQALYERAVRLDPSSFEALFNLGNVHHDGGHYTEAAQYYEQALTIDPNYADAYFYLAVTLEKMGRSSEARPHWKTYQDLAPDGEWVELAKEFSE